MSWQTVLGFEIHIELGTNSKMFCACSAAHFGVAPNTHVCPVCLGLPGALPVPNARAIEWCIKLGLALDCKINIQSKFDRKNYFYPDIPKGYQISQYDLPFCRDGQLLGHKIKRVHMEEDTGKLQHSGSETLIDFNRSGVPLVEVVTEADFVNSNDSDLFLKELQAIVRSLKISGADMEKGSMRLEANISLRPEAQKKLPSYKVEIKNVNSFRFIKKAVDFEVLRQTKLLEEGKTPIQETRGWSETKGETISQRVKEEANDYRYFPEPDIPPFEFANDQIEKWRQELPELPATKREVLSAKIPAASSDIIVASPIRLKRFEELSKVNDPVAVAKFLVNLPEDRIATAKFAQKQLIVDKTLITQTAKKVLADNPKAVADLKSGKQQAMFFLIGQIKKQIGDVDVKVARVTVEKLL